MQQDNPRSRASRASEITKFQVRCEAHERDGTWPTELARVLCLALVEAGSYPGELARKTSRDYRTIWLWTSGKVSPLKSTAGELEQVLDLRPGSLVRLAGMSQEQKREEMNQEWDNRRKSAGTLAKRKELMMDGKYHGGFPVRESLKLAQEASADRPTRGPQSLQGRIRKALFRVCYQDKNNGQFVKCLGCRKPLYRQDSLLKRGATHWHNKCSKRTLIGRPRGYRPAHKPGASALGNARMVLMADGLGLSAREIAELTLSAAEGAADADDAQAVRMCIVRGRKDLKGLLWGDLFPSKDSKPSSIHKVLKDFSVEEVLQIAAGTHPLSRVTDVDSVKKWFPTHSRDPLDGYSVADTALAQLVGESITERFPSVYAAAKSVGIVPTTLVGVIFDKHPTYSLHTWGALSTLTGLPVAELQALDGKATEYDAVLVIDREAAANGVYDGRSHKRGAVASELAQRIYGLLLEHPNGITAAEIHEQFRDGWVETDAFRAYVNYLNGSRSRGVSRHPSAIAHRLVYGTTEFEAGAQRWWIQRRLFAMERLRTARREGAGADAQWYVGERAPQGLIDCEAVPEGYHIRPIDVA